MDQAPVPPKAAVGVPTASFRTIIRDGQAVVQQLFSITFNAGSVQERLRNVWLDVDHRMFQTIETEAEAGLRHEVETLGKRLTIRRADRV